MSVDFILPQGTLGRFAVVKLWPEIKTAEDECIARLKLAAQAIGVECVEIYADGSFISTPDIKVSKQNVDFVIHLHYDTPKRYDAFSFVALWNPLKFYHEWGYQRCSRNLTTHDDFISCSSNAADDHVARMIRSSTTHLPAKFKLYHSTPAPIHPPSLGDGKLFYAGINWEAIVSSRKSRQQEVLKRLDNTGLLRIYGPTIFQGVKVWADYQSYVREIPFDGISMIDEISKAGAALVLSSQAHKDSEMMSNRLFETIAAGTLAICDENPFARKFLGDSVLYIDGRSSMEQIYADILKHLDWIKSNPEQALAKIEKAQAIFKDRFTLIKNLTDLYQGFAERKAELDNHHLPTSQTALKVGLYLLMPKYSAEVLDSYIQSVCVQEYSNFQAIIVIDDKIASQCRDEIATALAKCSTHIEIAEVEFYKTGIHPEINAKRRLGEILAELIEEAEDFDAITFVASNEQLFSNHLKVLVGPLQQNPSINCTASAAVLLNRDAPIHTVHEILDFGHVDTNAPPGYGRFMFRKASIPADINIALPYLDGRPLAALIGENKINHLLPATITINTQEVFPEKGWDEVLENEVIRDFSPSALGISARAAFQLPNPGSAVATLQNTSLGRLLLNPAWIRAQIHAVRVHGVMTRLAVLKRKLAR
ncbi:MULTISPECIES: glycosyltransferase family protein [unclassified Pseudomonas]|uniref:Glycosyltransferase family 1 protein n=1 Tax=Pseudomonas sp. MYb327 TaxID=2745230 RepID=A0AAU8DXS3_9PSED